MTGFARFFYYPLVQAATGYLSTTPPALIIPHLKPDGRVFSYRNDRKTQYFFLWKHPVFL